jgi:protein TonB
MKRALLLLMFAIPALMTHAQQTTPSKADPNADIVIDSPVSSSNDASGDSNKIYTSVEKIPEFPGGMEKFVEYLKTNLKYPAVARDNKVEGRVFVDFVVEKDGTLTNVKVVRGIGNGCDEEAVRVLKNSPKWHPGILNGHPVRVDFTLPISFEL